MQTGWGFEFLDNYLSRRLRRRPPGSKLAILASGLVTFGLVACYGGGSSYQPPPPPPPGPTEWFFVENFSGNVSGFSAASGLLAPIPGSSVMFPFALTNFALKPDGTFLAAITSTPQLAQNFQIANIASGGAMTLQPLTSALTTPGGMAISSKGMLAITDSDDSQVQLYLDQNNLLFKGGSAATGGLPEDVAFSADGKTLYVGNDGDGTVSVFSVSDQGALQPVQTAQFYVPSGNPGLAIVRIRLSPSGDTFAATTLDGVLYVAEVSAADHTLSNIHQIQLASLANLEEVIFDPSGKEIYTADQDNGGIFGFALATDGTLSPLPGSPYSTGALPGGPTGLAINATGDRIYVVMGAQSAIYTYSRDTASGRLSPTGDVVSAGGFLSGRIVRVPAH
jgi:DNA-binding beta-propeller fold protein YncE